MTFLRLQICVHVICVPQDTRTLGAPRKCIIEKAKVQKARSTGCSNPHRSPGTKSPLLLPKLRVRIHVTPESARGLPRFGFCQTPLMACDFR